MTDYPGDTAPLTRHHAVDRLAKRLSELAAGCGCAGCAPHREAVCAAEEETK